MNVLGCLHFQKECTASSELMCCEFNKDGSMVAAGVSNGQIQVFHPNTGSQLYHLVDETMPKYPVVSVSFKKKEDSVKNILLAVYASGIVCHWHTSTQSCVSKIREARQTLAVAYAPDCSTFTTAGADRKLLVYDETTHQLTATLEASINTQVMDGHASRVFSLKYHPTDPHLLISGGWDDTVQFWDTREKHSIRKLSGPHICGDAMDIEPETCRIATGSWRKDDNIQIWDFNTCKLIKTVYSELLDSRLYGVRWAQKDTLLVGGSQRNVVQVINTEYDGVHGEINHLSSGVYDVTYSPAIHCAAVATGSSLIIASVGKEKAFITQFSE
ncbi:WD repeat-containing protein 38-like isoform X2 [Dysidea avara]